MKAFDRNHIFQKICILFLFLNLAACAKPLSSPKPEIVTIAFQEWIGYGPFYLADEKGFFKEVGIRLEFVDEQLDSARRDAFKRGMLDCEGGTIDLLVLKTAQDTPISAVMGLDHSYGSDGIISTQDIKSLKDLIGKRVAFARDDVGETLIAYLFSEAGLSFSDIIIIPTAPEEAWRVFVEEGADAVVTWQPHIAKALKRPGSHLLASTKEHSDIIVDTFNVRKDLIRDKPELIKKMMRVWYKAVQYCKDHPEEANSIISKYFGLTPQEYGEQAKGVWWVDYKEAQAHHGPEEVKKAFRFISDLKFNTARIPKLPDADQAVDYSLWKELYENSQ